MKALLCTLSLAAGFTAAAASEQSPAQPALKLDIQSQPISDALNEFARQAGLQVFFLASADTKGVVSTALRGSYEDARTALRQLLANTGLDYEYLDAKTIAIHPVRPGTHGTRRMEQSESIEQIEQIIVRGARTTTATKMDTPILSVPQNIQVLSSKFIDDIGADLLEDALRHVAGVAVGGYYNGWDFFRIRGFDGVSYLDGLRTDTLGLNAEVFGLERVEVLKGPSSTLYGDGLLSGMVNIVSKRPQRAAFLDTAATVGNFAFREASLDLGGPLNASSTVYARLATLYREDGTFVDFASGLNRVYVAPSLTWEIGERTKLTVLSSYQKDRNELAFPLPAFGTVLANVNGRIPHTRFTGDGNDPGVTRDDSWALGYQFTHEFNDSVSIRQSVRQRWRTTDWERLIYPWFLDGDQRTLERYAYFIDDEHDADFTADTGVELRFTTGSLRHRMTIGSDFSHATNHAYSGFDFASMPLDLFDPVARGAASVAFPEMFPAAEKSQSLGFYVQDSVDLTERLTAMVGGRYQQVDGGLSDSIDPDDAAMDGGSAFVPNVGFSYNLVPGLYAYASYSEAFKGQFDRRLLGGGRAEPEQGVQYEAGLKAGLLDNRFNGTFSVYQLTRRNVLEPDPFVPDAYVATDKQRSRGVELDAQLLLLPNWEVIAGFAYTDAEVVPAGAPLRNVPRETLSLWSKYKFQTGLLRGVAVSLGGSYYSKQAGKDVAATGVDFDLPSYLLVDANISYQWRKTRFMVTFNNLLNERFFIGSYNENYVMPGTPRTIRFTAGWTY